MQDIYMDTPDGIMEVKFPYPDVDDVKAVYHEWAEPQAVYELILKRNGKELDPKFSNPQERKRFNEADRAE